MVPAAEQVAVFVDEAELAERRAAVGAAIVQGEEGAGAVDDDDREAATVGQVKRDAGGLIDGEVGGGAGVPPVFSRAGGSRICVRTPGGRSSSTAPGRWRRGAVDDRNERVVGGWQGSTRRVRRFSSACESRLLNRRCQARSCRRLLPNRRGRLRHARRCTGRRARAAGSRRRCGRRAGR